MGELKTIKISEIRENPVALRTVNRQSEEYLGLVQSIKEKGFLGSIIVRSQVDKESNESYYELVDGLHRFCAAKDAGLVEIGVDIVPLNEDQVLEAQIMANIHKIETRPAEYSQQLKRILARNPLMTEAELAKRLGKSPIWISQRLGLTRIDNEQVTELINSGKISLSNAYALAKLPPDELASFVERAMTLPPDEFIPAVNNRIKEIKEAKRSGQDPEAQSFQPVAHLRKLSEIKKEMDTPEIGAILIETLKIKKTTDAFNLAIQWMMHMDPTSIEAQKAEYDAREKKKAEEAAKRKVEREQKKAADAAKKSEEAAHAAANAQAELEGKPLPYPELAAPKTKAAAPVQPA
jgi:ParB/RepB/Spo0J family partition protein